MPSASAIPRSTSRSLGRSHARTSSAGYVIHSSNSSRPPRSARLLDRPRYFRDPPLSELLALLTNFGGGVGRLNRGRCPLDHLTASLLRHVRDLARQERLTLDGVGGVGM